MGSLVSRRVGETYGSVGGCGAVVAGPSTGGEFGSLLLLLLAFLARSLFGRAYRGSPSEEAVGPIH